MVDGEPDVADRPERLKQVDQVILAAFI